MYYLFFTDFDLFKAFVSIFICPRSQEVYIVTDYTKWVKTSWTYMYTLWILNPFKNDKTTEKLVSTIT